MLVGREWNVSDLAEQGRDAYLQTIRGRVKISVVESGGGNFIGFFLNPFRLGFFFWNTHFRVGHDQVY